MKEEIDKLLGLTTTEKMVLKMRYGILDGNQKHLKKSDSILVSHARESGKSK